MDESFLLGDEGGVFDQLCHSLASLCFALSLDKQDKEYLRVAKVLDLEADLKMKGLPNHPGSSTSVGRSRTIDDE